MTEKVYPVPASAAAHAWIDEAKYKAMYERSVKDPEGFWSEAGKIVDWMKPFTKAKNTSFAPGNVAINWFEDGTLNVSSNCVDRHLAKRGDQVAIIFEGDDPNVSEQITYRQLHERVQRFANVMKKHGVKKGDRVTIYLPMIPEAAYAMLACTRSAPFTRSSSAASRPTACRTASRTPIRSSSSHPMKACAAARPCP